MVEYVKRYIVPPRERLLMVDAHLFLYEAPNDEACFRLLYRIVIWGIIERGIIVWGVVTKENNVEDEEKITSIQKNRI